MIALVTGGAGFIGSAIARALLDNGESVRILDSFLTASEESVPGGAEVLRGDLRNPTDVESACDGAEVVFHEGAVRSVPRSVEEPLLTLECNVVGTMHLLLAAERAGVRRVVYASSSSVYGDTGGAPNSEDMPTNPMSPYAASKLAAENYCRIWSKLKGLSTVSLRYFNVFGPGQHPESKYAAVFPAFISALAAGRAPEVHGDGEQSRNFTYIGDVVRANLLASEADDRVDGAVINIGGAGTKTVNQALGSISRAMGKWVEPSTTPPRPGDIRHTKADITLANDLLGWTPQAEWEQAVAETVRWFLDKQNSAPWH